MIAKEQGRLRVRKFGDKGQGQSAREAMCGLRLQVGDGDLLSDHPSMNT